jgi:hypothetical protein
MSSRLIAMGVWWLALTLAACSGSTPVVPDAGPPDAGPPVPCVGSSADCGCTTDADCQITAYDINVQSVDQCYCLNCHEGAAAASSIPAHEASWDNFCINSDGAPDGGGECPGDTGDCPPQPTAICQRGICTAVP